MTAPSTVPEAGRSRWRDVLAGGTVALVLIPQSMACAELAGLPAHRGLLAGALPPLVASLLTSSPYLQTGPVAVTSLLTFGALSSMAVPGSDEYVVLACLLALVVGVVRLALGLLKAGSITYLMSQPVLRGFTAAAALVIVAGQVPPLLGLDAGGRGAVEGAARALSSPGRWDAGALTLGLLTLGVILGGQRFLPRFPAVLLAVVGGTLLSAGYGWGGPRVGSAEVEFLFSLDLPWSRLPSLFVSGALIAFVGFAEVASVAQYYAEQHRVPWDPDREFLSQGAANLASGLSGGFPVGGSLSRTSLAVLADARTRLAGGVAGATVLLFLPFAGLLSSLPRGVLAAIIIASVLRLLRPGPLLYLWKVARLQAAVGVATAVLTLALAPHVEYAVMGGIALSLAVHLWREQKVKVTAREMDGVLVLKPMGVIWFGSAPLLRQALVGELARHRSVRNVLVDLSAVGRIDVSGALVLREVVLGGAAAGLDVSFCFIPPHAERILGSVCADIKRSQERTAAALLGGAAGAGPGAPGSAAGG